MRKKPLIAFIAVMTVLVAFASIVLIGLVRSVRFGDGYAIRQIDTPEIRGGIVRTDPGVPVWLAGWLPRQLERHFVRVIEFQPQTLEGVQYAKRFRNLETLDLRQVEVRESVVIEFANLRNIKRIQVRRGQLSDEVLNELDQNRSDLTVQLLN
ncbi:MAG: hypothetical protein ACYSWO_00895 [Planctomycetota bacterium]|jgi:hypothetical protein